MRSPSRRLPRLPISALVVVFAFVATPAAPAAAADNATFLSIANRYRAEAGVGSLSSWSLLTQIADERAHQMASADSMYHDVAYVIDRVEDAGVCWRAVGENLAWHTGSQPDFERYFVQWYNSTPHRENLLKPNFRVAAGSWETGATGRHYAVMLFFELCSSTPPEQEVVAGFTDIANSIYRADIEWLAETGITSGCSATRFCPDALVTRGQMASFLARALGLPAASRDYFTDDGSSVHQADINRVAEAGIASGCGGTQFCPTAVVTRAQMASFLARAFGFAGTSRDFFVDDDGNTHELQINRLAASEVTTGCASARYCPGAGVSRGQMAAFLHRAAGK